MKSGRRIRGRKNRKMWSRGRKANGRNKRVGKRVGIRL
jgi:hypothetical protein